MPVYGVGIIGAGIIAADHAEACRQLPSRLRLVGAADVVPAKLRRLSAEHMIPFLYQDYRDLLGRADVDIVTICTPPAMHEEMVLAALQAGKHVLCEKPLAHNLESADRIVAAAEQAPGRLSVIYQVRYQYDVQRILWLRDHGRLGALKFGHFTRFDRAAVAAVSEWWGKWSVAGGGLVMTQFVHQLDLLCAIYGRPVAVSAWMDTVVAPIESEDSFTATVHFENGASVVCVASLAAQQAASEWSVFGTGGAVHVPWNYETRDGAQRRRDLEELERLHPAPWGSGSRRLPLPLRAARKALRLARVLPKPKRAPRHCGHTAYFAAFLDAIESGASVPVSPEEARLSLELCTAVYVSAISGRTVSLPIPRSSPYWSGVSDQDYSKRQVSYA